MFISSINHLNTVMSTTYHLSSAEELSAEIVDAIKATFKSKPITITIEEDDFELTDEMMLKLDERLFDVNATYITADESMQRLEKKYGL
jgi:hypothetical protein